MKKNIKNAKWNKMVTVNKQINKYKTWPFIAFGNFPESLSKKKKNGAATDHLFCRPVAGGKQGNKLVFFFTKRIKQIKCNKTNITRYEEIK